MADEPLMPEAGPVVGQAPPPNDSSVTLLVGLAVGLGYYWLASRSEDLGQEEGDEESLDDDEIEEPRPRRRLARLADATTDSLIDRPAVLARSGKPGDCYKAVKLLPASAGLAQTKTEQKIFRRVLKAVADDCRGAEDAVDDALEELEETREEIEEILGTDVSAVERDPEKAIAARRAAQEALIHGDLRRTKKKRVPKEPEIEALTRVSHSRGATSRGGRPRGASLKVRKPDGMSYRLRKEKAPTKRGFKWRKEND